ncbi:hypothetical protein GWO18_01205, partial [Candidatus Bathyarchaeota archaeon]|nr:hypothetical protein [Candidatus Bathyarchaeota archaeon]
MAKGVIILEQYAKQYPREEEQFTPEFQEVGGSIQILDKILLFKADGVVRRKDNNELIVIDHKSS